MNSNRPPMTLPPFSAKPSTQATSSPQPSTTSSPASPSTPEMQAALPMQTQTEPPQTQMQAALPPEPPLPEIHTMEDVLAYLKSLPPQNVMELNRQLSLEEQEHPYKQRWYTGSTNIPTGNAARD